MHQIILEKIHQGHQGIERCRQRVSSSVWWPGVSKDMENFVRSCPTCQMTTQPNRQPLISTPLSRHPWERVAADLFEIKNVTYLLVVDYYSRFVEVQRLNTTTSLSVITHLKSMFSRFGIPAEMVTDNGPQFDSTDMMAFCSSYGFRHIKTSPTIHKPTAWLREWYKDSQSPYGKFHRSQHGSP